MERLMSVYKGQGREEGDDIRLAFTEKRERDGKNTEK